MKPNDRFSFVKNNRVSQDTSSMVQCYLPIIGQEALSLYLYAVIFWDDGQKEHLFAAMLNHLNFGMDTLLKAFKTLTAMKLVTLYQQGESYNLLLHPPLSTQEFLQHTVYRTLLEKMIGDSAVAALRRASVEGEPISVALSQIFPQLSESASQETSSSQPLADDFDLEHFRQLMARDNLRIQDETSDVLA